MNLFSKHSVRRAAWRQIDQSLQEAESSEAAAARMAADVAAIRGWLMATWSRILSAMKKRFHPGIKTGD